METTGGGFNSVSVSLRCTCFPPWSDGVTFLRQERHWTVTAFLPNINPFWSGSKTWFRLSNSAAITQQRLGKMNAESTEDAVPLEKLSSPPSFSPKAIKEGTSPQSSILDASSSYTINLASSNVPPLLSLSGDEETLLWPLKVSRNK